MSGTTDLMEFAKFRADARELKQALAENAYPAADGTADIDNDAIDIIAVTVAHIVERETAIALRQREQETAAECIRIARYEHVSAIDLVVDHQPVHKGPFTIQDEATKSCADSIVKAILSRFPKDQT